MKTALRYITVYILGILSVVVFWIYILNTRLAYGKEDVYKDEITSIRVEAHENPTHKFITVSNNTSPLFVLEYSKKDREVYKAAIYDGNERAVGVFYLTDGILGDIEFL